MKKDNMKPDPNEEENKLLDLEEDGDSSDEDIDIYEPIDDADDDDYDKRGMKASRDMSDDDDEDNDDEDSENTEDIDEPSPFDGYDESYNDYDDENLDGYTEEEDIELNSVDDEDISDEEADEALNSQYIEDADEYLRACGLEPCAADWVKMSLEKRQDITKQLADIRDNNPDNKQLVNATGNALFFLNIKFFLRVCHRKVQKHSSGGQDYQNKVQSALAAI